MFEYKIEILTFEKTFLYPLNILIEKLKAEELSYYQSKFKLNICKMN